MESVGAILESSEWSSFNAMYSNYEESDFMVQLLNNYSVSHDFHDFSSFNAPSLWPDHESINMVGVDVGSMNFPDNTDGNISGSCDSGFLFPTPVHDHATEFNQMLVINNDCMSKDFDDFLNQDMSSCHIEESGGDLPEADICVKNPQLGSEAQLPEPVHSKEVELKKPMQKSKKRCSSSGDVQNSKRNVKSRKSQKLNSTSKNDEGISSAIPRQNLSSYFSDEDSNTSHELINGMASTLDSKEVAIVDISGKTRSNKSPATDPQSLYARKRRERINQRLRTLQNLVPNGTKVDISTMLDEAVQYVKFLQLQIKLLSSDDLWMYAPIAYNGMDLALALKNIPMPR